MPRFLFPKEVKPKYESVMDKQSPTFDDVAYKAVKSIVGDRPLDTLVETILPFLATSQEAEAASPAMKKATKLADIFMDWYKNGKPIIQTPTSKWKDIITSGKFKNQMELTDDPKAWNQRINVERILGGIPKPNHIKDNRSIAAKYNDHMFSDDLDALLNDLENVSLFSGELPNGFIANKSGKEAKKHPVYGHIINPDYYQNHAAVDFGDTGAVMSDKVKEGSRYILGDSFAPFIPTTFNHSDLTGKTSKLERSLFETAVDPWGIHADNILGKNGGHIQETVPFMEMWIPNHLATTNNIKSIELPNKQTIQGPFTGDRGLPQLLDLFLNQ